MTYRIRRADPRNLVIEELHTPNPDHRMTKADSQPTWKIVGYYGNNPESLTSGLIEIAGRDYDPDLDDELLDQLMALSERLQRVKGEVLEMLKVELKPE